MDAKYPMRKATNYATNKDYLKPAHTNAAFQALETAYNELAELEQVHKKRGSHNVGYEERRRYVETSALVSIAASLQELAVNGIAADINE